MVVEPLNVRQLYRAKTGQTATGNL